MRQLKIYESITNRSEDSLNKYLNDISHYERITADREAELMQIIHRGGKEAEKAREELVNANLRFVVSVAKQHVNSGVPLSDLINEGNIGRLRAVESFDETRGFKFISYAVWWIRQCIMQAIADQKGVVRIPCNQANLLSKVKAAMAELEQKEQRPATVQEICELNGLEESRVTTLLANDKKQVSIDKPMVDDEDRCLSDTLTADENSRADKTVDQQSLREDLSMILKGILTQKEHQIIVKSFGLDCESLTIDDIAEEMGVSRERVRQICDRSLKKVRDDSRATRLMQYL